MNVHVQGKSFFVTFSYIQLSIDIMLKFLGIIFISLFIGACGPCSDSFKSIFAPQQCSNPSLKFLAVRNIIPPLCVGVLHSRKVSVACAASSGTVGACQSPATGSAYYFIFVPNNRSGTFLDSAAGVINNCEELWVAISSATPPSDIIGAYFSDPTIDTLTCTDGGGCAGTSTNCISGWNSITTSPSGVAISLPNATSLLACGFIDVTSLGIPAPGPPPVVGSNVPSIANSTQFVSITVTGNLNFNLWQDY